MPREKTFGPQIHLDRSGNVMVSPEKNVLINNVRGQISPWPFGHEHCNLSVQKQVTSNNYLDKKTNPIKNELAFFRMLVSYILDAK